MKWPEVAFQSLYELPSRNGIYKAKSFHGSGAKIVNMGELFKYNFVGPQEMARLRVDDSEQERFGLQDGDLLFARRSLVEAGAGKCVVVEGVTEPTVFESSLIRVRLSSDTCNPRYYYYYFGCPPGRSRIEAIITGVAQKGIRSSDLASITVHHPDLPTQHRIADILSAYDDLIENNNRRMALLEETIHLLYREWFVYLRFPGHERVKVVDGVPEGWRRAIASELIDFNPRTAVLKDEVRPYVPMGSLSTTSMRISDIEERLPKGGAKFQNEDTLLARITPCLENGKTGFVQFLETGEETATGSTEFIVMRGTKVPPTWVYCLARSATFRQHAINSMTGSDGRQRVDKDSLKGFALLLPPTRVLGEWESVVRVHFDQVHLLSSQNQRLREARDLLLPRLMNGSIAV